MALIEFKDNPSDRELRQFAALWLPLFCAAVAGVVFYRSGSATVPLTMAAGGLLIGLIGAKRVAFIRPVFLGAMLAAYPVGWVVSHALLAVIYYLVVAPMGLLLRLAGYDPLQRRFDRDVATYWEPLDLAPSKRQYFRPL